jgi:hypothetical protein
MTLTKPQRAAVKKIADRMQRPYREVRRTVLPSPGCVMVPFAGMWLGIEPDGNTHS